MSRDAMSTAITRRHFVAALGAGTATALLATAAGAQDRATSQTSAQGSAQGNAQGGPQAMRTTMSGPMNENAYHPVELPAKAGAPESMTPAERDALEHQIHCQCGCTLDVYTCRTTDFTCPVSPAMHQDVVRLVSGGYTGPEIIDAFRATYGERVLMAPTREGFNWAGYITPFVALGAGASIVAVLIQRWKRAATASASAHPPGAAAGERPPAGATPDELARLEAAVRDDA